MAASAYASERATAVCAYITATAAAAAAAAAAPSSFSTSSLHPPLYCPNAQYFTLSPHCPYLFSLPHLSSPLTPFLRLLAN